MDDAVSVKNEAEAKVSDWETKQLLPEKPQWIFYDSKHEGEETPRHEEQMQSKMMQYKQKPMSLLLKREDRWNQHNGQVYMRWLLRLLQRSTKDWKSVARELDDKLRLEE